MRLGTCSRVGQRTGHIDQRFFRIWSRRPLIMGTDGGGYLRTSIDVISGMVVRKPASIALQRVDRAGDPIAACRNVMRWLINAWGCSGWRCRLYCGQRQQRTRIFCVGLGLT